MQTIAPNTSRLCIAVWCSCGTVVSAVLTFTQNTNCFCSGTATLAEASGAAGAGALSMRVQASFRVSVHELGSCSQSSIRCAAASPAFNSFVHRASSVHSWILCSSWRPFCIVPVRVNRAGRAYLIRCSTAQGMCPGGYYALACHSSWVSELQRVPTTCRWRQPPR